VAFAENTTVPVEKSIAEIISLVKRAGAERIAQFDEPERFTVQFTMRERMVRFRVAIPSMESMDLRDGRGRQLTRQQRIDRAAQAARQRARALLLVIKAKLESVASKVETFEQAFLSNVVMSDGATVYERIAEPIAEEYATGGTSMLLLGGPGGAVR
jgi:hypothetical protein